MATAQAAARVEDIISHTAAFPGALIGLAIGAALVAGTVVAAVATIATGGLALAPILALAGAAATVGVAGFVGDLVGTLIPISDSGHILTGENSIWIGRDLHIAATCNSDVLCKQHSASKVAEGSATVLFGRSLRPAARVGDRGTCDFKIGKGENSVLIGGAAASCCGLTVGTETPTWLYLTMGALTLPEAIISLGVTGTLALFALGAGANVVGERLFGHDTFGAKAFSFVACMIGAKGIGKSGLALDAEIVSGVRSAGRSINSALDAAGQTLFPQPQLVPLGPRGLPEPVGRGLGSPELPPNDPMQMAGEGNGRLDPHQKMYDDLGDEPPKINLKGNDTEYGSLPKDAAHTVDRHDADIPLRRGDAPLGDRTTEGRIYGDPPWRTAENNSYKWLDSSTMNRTTNDYIQNNWDQIRMDIATDGVHDNTYDAGHAVGEGFYNEGIGGPGVPAGPRNAVYHKTSLVRIIMRSDPSGVPKPYVVTTYPTSRGPLN